MFILRNFSLSRKSCNTFFGKLLKESCMFKIFLHQIKFEISKYIHTYSICSIFPFIARNGASIKIISFGTEISLGVS